MCISAAITTLHSHSTAVEVYFSCNHYTSLTFHSSRCVFQLQSLHSKHLRMNSPFMC